MQHQKDGTLHYSKDGNLSCSSSDGNQQHAYSDKRMTSKLNSQQLELTELYPKNEKRIKEAFLSLVRYNASTELDRKLILGVLESDNDAKDVSL